MGLDLSRGRLKPESSTPGKGRQRSPLSHERSTASPAFASSAAASPPPPTPAPAPQPTRKPFRAAGQQPKHPAPAPVQPARASSSGGRKSGALPLPLPPPTQGRASPAQTPAQVESVGESPRIVQTVIELGGDSSDSDEGDGEGDGAMPPPRSGGGASTGGRFTKHAPGSKAATRPPEVRATGQRFKPLPGAHATPAPVIVAAAKAERFTAQIVGQADYIPLSSQVADEEDAPRPSQPLDGDGGGAAGSSSPRFQSPAPVVIDEEEGSDGGETLVDGRGALEKADTPGYSQGSRDMSVEGSSSPAPPKRGFGAVDDGEEQDRDGRETTRRRVERSDRSISPASFAPSRSVSLAPERAFSLAPPDFHDRDRDRSASPFSQAAIDINDEATPAPTTPALTPAARRRPSRSPSASVEPVRLPPPLGAFYPHEQRPHLQFARAHAAQHSPAAEEGGADAGWDAEGAAHERRFAETCVGAGGLVQSKSARGTVISTDLSAHGDALEATAQALRESKARIWAWGAPLFGGTAAAAAVEGEGGAVGEKRVGEGAPLLAGTE
ncbi:hypothetical protein JCM10450v2_000997 [Rhodotorula kratochvilovae]